MSAERNPTVIPFPTPPPTVQKPPTTGPNPLHAWEEEMSKPRHMVSMSGTTAAVIARELAFTQRLAEPGPALVPSITERRTVTLSGHAAAVIAGFLGPPDRGNSSERDDRQRVWKRGIFASEETLAEIQAAFPVSLAEQLDPATVNMPMVAVEMSTAFPLHVFREWADKSMELYELALTSPEYAIEDLVHVYDPEAGT